MKREDISKYKEIKDKTFTTSEVIKDSFVQLIKSLDKNDYVIVENTRQKKTMVVQNIDTFLNINEQKVEDNKSIRLAKQEIKNNIFYLMRFESPDITFPEIETILDNGKVSTKRGFDAQLTKQLMDAWKYVLYSPKKMDVDQVIYLQGIIAKNQALEWGKLRTGKVMVSGTNYEPPVVKKKELKTLIDDFEKAKNKYKCASELLPRLIKMQPFWDGNKRTAFLTINRLLIESNLGLIILNEKLLLEFNKLLNDYYNNENKIKEISKFIETKMTCKI